MKKIIFALTLLIPIAATAQTAASSKSGSDSQAASVASGGQQSIKFESGTPSDKLYTNPQVYLPGGYAGFSPMNCANAISAGGSGGLIALGFGGPKESVQCNGRADATILMQMSNALRQVNPMIAANLAYASTVVMCQQSDATRKAMEMAQLCPESHDQQPVVLTHPVSEGDARASLDNLYSGS